MDERERSFRLECLKLAVGTSNVVGGRPADETVEAARLYADFVLGVRDGEIVAAAHKIAGIVTAASDKNRPQP